MKFFALLNIVAFAATVNGAPQFEHRQARHVQRNVTRNKFDARSGNPQTSENWSGVILLNPPEEGVTFSSVTGSEYFPNSSFLCSENNKSNTRTAITVPTTTDTGTSRVAFWSVIVSLINMVLEHILQSRELSYEASRLEKDLY